MTQVQPVRWSLRGEGPVRDRDRYRVGAASFPVYSLGTPGPGDPTDAVGLATDCLLIHP